VWLAGLGGKIVFTIDKLKKAWEIEGVGHKNKCKSEVIP